MRIRARRGASLFPITKVLWRDINKMKYMNIKEFRDTGYLHELNRLFLHPLGLAMEISIDEETNEQYISGIWDCRDEAEGIYYAEDTLNPTKVLSIESIMSKRYIPRLESTGYWIQPVVTDDAR